MDRRYKFRTASSIVGFIDFFLTLLAISLLVGGILILPGSATITANLFQHYSTFGVIAVWLLVILVWTIMWIAAIKLVRATVGNTNISESTRRLVFWRIVNFVACLLLIVGFFFIHRNAEFASWVPQVLHLIFRIFGISIVSVHLSELREIGTY